MKYLLGVCLALVACTADDSTGGEVAVDAGVVAADAATACADSTLTYANFGEALISTSCLSCHAGKERPTLATQAQVQANRVKIIAEAVTTTRMPERATLSLTDRQKLGEWLRCGAP